MDFDRRRFLLSTAATSILPSALAAQEILVLRPEGFGAKGDGVTNDARAFAALSAEVNRRGGGTVVLTAGRTYIIGAQYRGGDYGWSPRPVLELNRLSGPIRILGNGARVRCAPGLRYGAFNPETGAPTEGPAPSRRVAEAAVPYIAMIHISRCSGSIEIREIELDGNLQGMRIGGQFGDTGWQIPATGLLLEENTGPESVTDVLSHHHAQDGAMIIGAAERSGRGQISRLVCRYNGRQGCSVTAGRGYVFADCEFSHTGRSTISSAPGAGVDIEAERRPIRDLTFTRCKFVDNHGVGMVADSGDSEGVRFVDCLFVGTTTWSAWPFKPRFSFRGCSFVGSVVHAFSDANPLRATQFADCHFTDDPRRSPTGKVYVGNGPIVNLATSDNVLFDGCTFRLVGAGLLPWSWRATYRNCTMTQRSPRKATPKGRYLGRSSITGNVDLYGAMVQGELRINGRVIPPGSQGGPPW
jgi:hypothetical protein